MMISAKDTYPKGKWWWVAMEEGNQASTFPVLSCSLALPKAAPSLICLKPGLITVSPSCLGVGWLSVEGGVLALAP